MKHEVKITITMLVDGFDGTEAKEAIQELLQDEFEFQAPSVCQVTDVDVQVETPQDEDCGWDGEEDDEVEEISFDELQHSPVH